MVLLLLACHEAPAPEPPDEAVVPTAYDVGDYADDPTSSATFDQAAIDAALQAAVDAALSAPAQPLVEAYADAMGYGDEACPSLYDVDGNIFWYDYCTADSGAYFYGYGTYLVYNDTDVFGDGGSFDGAYVSGLGQITDPDGHLLEIGGTAGYASGTLGAGYPAWLTVLEGGFVWDDPDATGTWLDAGLNPTLTIYAIDAVDLDVHYVTVEGAMGGILDASGDPSPYPTATFEGLVLANEIPGYFPCEEEPAGTIALRDALGAWYEVTFDLIVTDDKLTKTGTCDGCGTVTVEGVEVGEACADFSGWLDWEEAPW